MDISNASFPRGIGVMASARTQLLQSLDFLTYGGMPVVIPDISFNISLGIMKTITNHLAHYFLFMLDYVHTKYRHHRNARGCYRYL